MPLFAWVLLLSQRPASLASHRYVCHCTLELRKLLYGGSNSSALDSRGSEELGHTELAQHLDSDLQPFCGALAIGPQYTAAHGAEQGGWDSKYYSPDLRSNVIHNQPDPKTKLHL